MVQVKEERAEVLAAARRLFPYLIIGTGQLIIGRNILKRGKVRC